MYMYISYNIRTISLTNMEHKYTHVRGETQPTFIQKPDHSQAVASHERPVGLVRQEDT